MEEAIVKINQIRQFIDEYMRYSKERGKMYGSVGELEGKWELLDHIYFILENVHDKRHIFQWGAFLASKGFGANDAAHIIEEAKAENPYVELIKLRNEYEEWRKNKMDEFKKD